MMTQPRAPKSKRTLISPSLLACDFARLADEMEKVEAAGADWVHVDVMDGHFVPNLTIGPVVVKAIRKVSNIPLDVHLMIDHPTKYLAQFLDAGAHYVTVHIEAPDLINPDVVNKILKDIRTFGAKAGLSIKPNTKPDVLKPYLDALDLILVMSVEPGFGGQSFITGAIPKVKQLRGEFQGHISVDGGVNFDTGRLCREAGADVLVAGTYVFGAASYEKAIQSLREEHE